MKKSLLFLVLAMLGCGSGESVNDASVLDSAQEAAVVPDAAEQDSAEEEAGPDMAQAAEIEIDSPADSSEGGPDAADTLAPQDSSPEVSPVIALEKLGPFGIGVVTLHAVSKPGREFDVEVWYPTAPADNAVPYAYMGFMSSKSAVGGADASPEGPFPLVGFSHGNMGFRAQSYFLCEYLAANGYVVAAPDHPNNTFFDNDEDKVAETALERPHDISVALDRVLNAEAGDPAWLAGLADADRIGVAGHSFGGYTALAIAGATLTVTEEAKADCLADPSSAPWCDTINQLPGDSVDLSDPRVKASVPLAPAGFLLFGPDGMAGAQCPVEVQAGASDSLTTVADEQQPMYDNLPSPKYLMILEHADHFTFTNICDLMPYFGEAPALKDRFGAICEPDAPVPVAEEHERIRAFALAFFDLYLKQSGGDPAILDPANDTDPEVTLQAAP